MKRCCCAIALLLAEVQVLCAQERSTAATPHMVMKTESFDRDPGWDGVNNRSARRNKPRRVQQDFGYSAGTRHCGGVSAGEIGGFISPAAEAAYYAKLIEPADFNQPMKASGKMWVGRGSTNLLLGFFNAATVNEWRTPNTIALRINARGDRFFAYVEYCTAKWRAGGDTTPFPSTTDPDTGRASLIGFPCETSLPWTLEYDPRGHGGLGLITATIGDAMAACNVEKSHKQDGANFNRFGMINVIKSADSGSRVWFDDIRVNGAAVESFSRDPNWQGRNNRQTFVTRYVRPWFDFGFTNSNKAGGKAAGELGGQLYRGDCRYPDRIACYGDRIGPLTLDKPLRASGRIAMTRGVSDSTTLFGFYNSHDSMHVNPSQKDGVPEGVLGIHIEGPSSDGFRFYPVLRCKGANSLIANYRTFPSLLPDGQSHKWSLEYRPGHSGEQSQICICLDSKSTVWMLDADALSHPPTFDRFGIVTSWIDGNSQSVFWDDISYTVAQE